MIKPLLFFTALLTIAPLLSAQAPRHCYDPGPLPKCKTFWITEAGGSVRFAQNHPTPTFADSRKYLLQANLGLMSNRSARTALGGAGFITWSDDAYNIGVAPRFRWWARPNLSVDLAPGVIVFQGGARLIGFNGQLGVNVGPYVSAISTLRVTHAGVFDPQGNALHKVDWFIGARLNGKPGTFVGIGGPIVALVTYLFLYSRVSD